MAFLGTYLGAWSHIFLLIHRILFLKVLVYLLTPVFKTRNEHKACEQ